MTKKLSGSQIRSAAALISAGVLDLNEVLKSATTIPSLHIPVAVTGGVSLLALLITSFSRSLDKANSGNGAGLAGQTKTAGTSTVEAKTETGAVETATAPEMLTAAGASVLDVLVPRLPPEMQAEAAGVISGMLAEHLKEQGAEAQVKAKAVKAGQTLMGGLGAAADDRAAALGVPPSSNTGFNSGEGGASSTGGALPAVTLVDDTPPAPIARPAGEAAAPASLTEASQE